MTRAQFEKEFKEKITDTKQGDAWHSHVLRCLPSLSQAALDFIVDDESNAFGDWIKEAAYRHCSTKILEDAILDTNG